MSEYAQQAKKLLSVCSRLENWFSGQKLYESVETKSNDGAYKFRWNSRNKRFEYIEEFYEQWKKVIQPHHPMIMARFISVVPDLHRMAIEKKEEVAETLYVAAEAGEQYLQRISGFIDDDLGEQETSDNE